MNRSKPAYLDQLRKITLRGIRPLTLNLCSLHCAKLALNSITNINKDTNMKTTIITITLAIISYTSIAQDLKHQEIKEKIYTSIEANFPNRFNSYQELKNIFYGRCNEYPKHCQKLRFNEMTDFRIIEVVSDKENTKANIIDTPSNNHYKIEASFDFSYKTEKIDHYGNGIVECVIQKVIDGYEIDYIKIIGVKGLHEYYESVEDGKFYILNQLAYRDQ
jgi:hypothetical protein